MGCNVTAQLDWRGIWENTNFIQYQIINHLARIITLHIIIDHNQLIIDTMR